jgi:hypothetical protein
MPDGLSNYLSSISVLNFYQARIMNPQMLLVKVCFEKASENKGSVLLREDCWKSVAAMDLAPTTRTLVEDDARKLEIVAA